MAGVAGDVGHHGGVTRDPAQAFPQHRGHPAVPTRQVLLTIEDAEDDIAEPCQGDPAPGHPRPVSRGKYFAEESEKIVVLRKIGAKKSRSVLTEVLVCKIFKDHFYEL